MEQPGRTPPQQNNDLRLAWMEVLPLLTNRERQELGIEMRRRIWRSRLLAVKRIPAPVKLGIAYSLLALSAILAVPLPHQPALFVPLLIAAAGCVALTLVMILDLLLGLALVQVRPQVPPFDAGSLQSELVEFS